jgi:hypothetical protein
MLARTAGMSGHLHPRRHRAAAPDVPAVEFPAFANRLMHQRPPIGNIGQFIWILLPILSGCAIHTVGAPIVRTIAVSEKFPTSAVVLIEQSTVEKLTRKRPVVIGWGRPHTFRLGEMLEQGSTQAFSQVFQGVNVVRLASEAGETPLIEPTVELIRFFYWPEWLLWWHATARVKVHTRVILNDHVLWEATTTGTEGRKPNGWVRKLLWNNRLDEMVGGAVADAMAIALESTARRMANDATFRAQLLETKPSSNSIVPNE